MAAVLFQITISRKKALFSWVYFLPNPKLVHGSYYFFQFYVSVVDNDLADVGGFRVIILLS